MFLSSSMPLAVTRMAEVSLKYREDVATGETANLWFLAVPVVAISVSFLIYRIADRPPAVVNTPYGMLNELCRVHQVGKAGRVLLTQIAEEIGLPQPATMLLGETQFEAAVAKAGEEIEYSRRQSATLGTLRRRLFI
jgi:hypothetical protein